MEVLSYEAIGALPVRQTYSAEPSLMQRTHERVVRQLIIGFLFIVAASFIMANGQPVTTSSTSSSSVTTPPASRPLTVTMDLSPTNSN